MTKTSKYDISSCMNCGINKPVIATGSPSMLKHLDMTSHCCEKPSYFYDPEATFYGNIIIPKHNMLSCILRSV